ncbi:hypothetical protein ROZALSC1DRAFT_27903, partial [Rozella allomycis CSF55]
IFCLTGVEPLPPSIYGKDNEFSQMPILRKSRPNWGVLGTARNWINYSTKLPPEPEPPSNCCMSGCEKCVWIEYLEDVKEYEKKYNVNLIEKLDPELKSFVELQKSLLQARDKSNK